MPEWDRTMHCVARYERNQLSDVHVHLLYGPLLLASKSSLTGRTEVAEKVNTSIHEVSALSVPASHKQHNV